jgi:hypothetical protein
VPNRTHRAGSNYIDPATLRAIVRAYQSTKEVTEELARVLLAIAGGVWDRFRFTEDRDDFAQDVVAHLLGNPLDRVSADGNAFGYFTTCAIRYGQKLRDKAARERSNFHEYAAALRDSGRELPARRDYADDGE